jgi:TPR repeat protein
MLLTGDGVKKDIREAVRLFEQSAQHGCHEANFNLWGIFHAGIEGAIPRDPIRAERYARIGSEHQIVGCELEYADILGPGEKADKLRAHALAPGRAAAQIDAGQVYESGLFFPTNLERARLLYETAGAEYQSDGLFHLGKLLLEQLHDVSAAAQVLRKGVKAKNTALSAYLGINIKQGIIPAGDDDYMAMLRFASGRKNAQATVALGQAFRDKGDFPNAYRSFKRAHELGRAEGSEELAKCHEEGIGCERNLARAEEVRREAERRREPDRARARASQVHRLDAHICW